MTCCPHCGAEFELKRPTKDQRGFWYGVLVEALMQDHGYATKLEAHDALVRAVCTLPWETLRPSTSDAEMTREEMSDLIERACAYLVVDLGIRVPDPQPDPVRRLEQAS